MTEYHVTFKRADRSTWRPSVFVDCYRATLPEAIHLAKQLLEEGMYAEIEAVRTSRNEWPILARVEDDGRVLVWHRREVNTIDRQHKKLMGGLHGEFWSKWRLQGPCAWQQVAA
jgi:hypothetical protein